MLSMKSSQKFVLGFATVVFAVVTYASVAEDKTNHAAHHDDVTKILRKRLAVLQQVVDLQRQAYRKGEARIDQVLGAEIAFLRAKIEIAKKPTERIAIRTATVEAAKQLEKVSEELFRAKEVTRADVLKAQAFRLRAEADLLLEKSHAHAHRH